MPGEESAPEAVTILFNSFQSFSWYFNVSDWLRSNSRGCVTDQALSFDTLHDHFNRFNGLRLRINRNRGGRWGWLRLWLRLDRWGFRRRHCLSRSWGFDGSRRWHWGFSSWERWVISAIAKIHPELSDVSAP